MKATMNAPISRRAFFRIAATLTGSVAVAGTGLAQFSTHRVNDPLPSLMIRLNPAFRIREISGMSVELFTHLPDGNRLTYHFVGFEADILRQLDNGTMATDLRAFLSQRYDLPERSCETKLMKSLAEFETGKLVYYGDLMVVKKSETAGGH